MSAVVVIGSQWGDEGKGKVVDVFSSQADYVIRYQGGANAGHTLKVNGKEIILHLIPSGVLHSQVSCVISTGVVLDVEALVKEIQALKNMGYDHRRAIHPLQWYSDSQSRDLRRLGEC